MFLTALPVSPALAWWASKHVGLIMDGNRRWARQVGMANPSLGQLRRARATLGG